ncbi:MAG: ElyC/SanA/YdcF family protein [Candidatus Altimarinota bacterium]
MRRLFTTLILFLLFLILPWGWISWVTKNDIYRNPDLLPKNHVGLLLGTTPSINGVNNVFFSTRIEAAKVLFERGKIEHILVSGDNSTKAYNEPEAMRKALLKAGIPESAITLDYAGFRTLDSVVRAKEIFGQGSGFTIISQPFHVERALFLARSNHIEAIGYGSANVSLSLGLYTYIREIAARWRAIIDGIIGTDPVILGSKEKLTGER